MNGRRLPAQLDILHSERGGAGRRAAQKGEVDSHGMRLDLGLEGSVEVKGRDRLYA